MIIYFSIGIVIIYQDLCEVDNHTRIYLDKKFNNNANNNDNKSNI